MKRGKIMKQERYFYPAVFNYDDEEIAVTFPDLNVATSGVDKQDALISARELLGIVLFGLEEDNEDIPKPSRLSDVKLKKGETVNLINAYI